MNLFILSNRSNRTGVTSDCVYELEDLIVKTCGATLLAPHARDSIRWLHQQRGYPLPLAQKIARKTVGIYEPPRVSIPRKQGPNVLLVISLNGTELELLTSIAEWRHQFDVVFAYVFDCWELSTYPACANQIDHLFIPVPEAVDFLHKRLGLPVSFMPLGSDVLTHGSPQTNRPIDILSYGRIPESFHQEFSRAFNQPNSEQFYVRLISRPGETFPKRPYEEREDMRYRQMLFQYLRRSKLAVAFDTMFPGMRKFPYSFVTMRWFECGGAGCAIVGKPPTSPQSLQLLDWPDSTIELPDDPTESVQFLKDLLNDTPRLHALHRRNYLENLTRHDWRIRLRQMFDTLQLPTPKRLLDELELIQQRRIEAELLPWLNSQHDVSLDPVVSRSHR